MLEHVELDYTDNIRDLARNIRQALIRRSVVRIPKFSRNQNDLRDLANQLGIIMPVPGSTIPGPLSVMNQSDAPDAPWWRNTAPYYQQMASNEPVIVLDYCVDPTGFIRWFCDQTEVYKHVDTTRLADELFTTTRIGALPYARITDDDPVWGSWVKNHFHHGMNEIFLDQAEDLFVYLSDGIATGRLPGTNPRQGLWMRNMVAPDWDLMQPS